MEWFNFSEKEAVYSSKPLPALNPVGFVLMVDIKEDDTVFGNLVTKGALFDQLRLLFAAACAPVVDQAVVAPTDILLEAAMVFAVHPAVGIGGILKETVDDAENARVSRMIVFPDLLHLGGEGGDGDISKG
jgi:hypothetical protein